MYGKDWEYANSRLFGTVVRLGDEPVFVHEVMPGMVARLAKLSNIYEEFQVDAGELNLVPVPLGMCNFEGRVSYLSRIPLRRDWRQGLRRENFTSDDFPHAAIPPDVLGRVIMGQYPRVEDALSAHKEGKALAWHRHWGITAGGVLKYKWDNVGKIVGQDFVLAREYQHLYEALEEAV